MKKQNTSRFSHFSKCAIATLLATSLLLSGCGASTEASAVIKDIKNIGDVTLDSKDTLDEIYQEYKDLSEEDKEEVTNYDDLKSALDEYDDLYIQDLEERIAEELSASSPSYEKLSALLEECEAEPGRKGKVSNYKELATKTEEARTSYGDDQYQTIYNKMASEGSKDEGYEELEKYKDALTEDQIKECLAMYGKWKAPSKASDLIKTYLKSPSSYNEYSCTIDDPTMVSLNGLYKVKVTLKYGATNSFNAEVTDEASVYVYYYVIPVTLSVKYSDAELAEGTSFN